MKIDVKINLDKENESEIGFSNMINMWFGAYNLTRNFEDTLPEITCEQCDCESSLEYRISCDVQVTKEFLQKTIMEAFKQE